MTPDSVVQETVPNTASVPAEMTQLIDTLTEKWGYDLYSEGLRAKGERLTRKQREERNIASEQLRGNLKKMYVDGVAPDVKVCQDLNKQVEAKSEEIKKILDDAGCGRKVRSPYNLAVRTLESDERSMLAKITGSALKPRKVIDAKLLARMDEERKAKAAKGK